MFASDIPDVWRRSGTRGLTKLKKEDFIGNTVFGIGIKFGRSEWREKGLPKRRQDLRLHRYQGSSWGCEIHPWGTGASSEKWRESGRWRWVQVREEKPWLSGFVCLLWVMRTLWRWVLRTECFHFAKILSAAICRVAHRGLGIRQETKGSQIMAVATVVERKVEIVSVLRWSITWAYVRDT